MEQFKVLERVIDEEEDLAASIVLLSYHHWAKVDLTHVVILASFLALWLKRCIVPSVLGECLTLKDFYPAISLASRRSLGLLPAMIYRITRD